MSLDGLYTPLKNRAQTVLGGKRHTDVGAYKSLPCAGSRGVDERHLAGPVDADYGIGCFLV
jgi:hypothetical protein